MLFSLLKHYLDTDTVLKVSQSVYCFTTSMSHGVENYFPRLWVRASLMLFSLFIQILNIIFRNVVFASSAMFASPLLRLGDNWKTRLPEFRLDLSRRIL